MIEETHFLIARIKVKFQKDLIKIKENGAYNKCLKKLLFKPKI